MANRGNNAMNIKDKMFGIIRLNIATSGHHIYMVAGGASPRFAYTIGISEATGYELIFAGGSYFHADDVTHIINKIAVCLKQEDDCKMMKIEIDDLGTFSLENVDPSWAKIIILGALDFYNIKELPALQIIPDKDHWTVDIPNMIQPWNVKSEPLWQWLDDGWVFPIPVNSTAITNLDALRGALVTEAVRWEKGQWELFAGSGLYVADEDIREVSLGTLLGADSSLCPVVNLGVGEGLWRDPDKREWHPWEDK